MKIKITTAITYTLICVVVLLAVLKLKHSYDLKVEAEYEASVQTEVNKEVEEDAGKVKEQFDSSSSAIDESVNSLLNSEGKSRLPCPGERTANAKDISQGGTDVGTQGGLPIDDTSSEQVPTFPLPCRQEIETTNGVFTGFIEVCE